MLNSMTFYLILGKPLIMWVGVMIMLCLIATAAVGGLLMKGSRNRFVTMKTHKIMAGITLALGIMHGVLSMLAFF